MDQKRKRILFVENTPLKIRAIVRALEERRYSPAVIHDLEQARSELKTHWWPLAVVDLRLVNDEDDQDFSGLELVRETDPNITKLILTTYPTYQAAVQALQPHPGKLPPAVDFLSKLDPLEQIVERIVGALEVQTGINWMLETSFYDSFHSYHTLADWFHRRAQEDKPLRQSVAESAHELEDLWGRLFSTQTQITVYPSRRGRGDAFLSQVKPYTTAVEAMVVVKFGWRHDVDQEEKNYEKWVRPHAGPVCTQKQGIARTLNFAAIKYSLVGGHLHETQRFADFYRVHEVSAILEAIHHLFGTACAPWYDLPRRSAPEGISQRYRKGAKLVERRAHLQEAVRRLAQQGADMGFTAQTLKSNVRFEWPGGPKLDLKTLESWLYDTPKALKDSPALAPFQESPTHGDLNADNILVDPQRRTWLIDFGRTGYGYRLRDFAELESCIALDLQSGEAGLAALVQFEKLVFSQERWKDGLALPPNFKAMIGNDDLIKAIQVIQELRSRARQWEEDGGELRRYYLALLFEAILRLVTEGRDSPTEAPLPTRRAHALLRAATIIDALTRAE